jgi:beta-ureidopropionase
MYEEPIHPKNLWLEQDPLPHAEVDEIYRANIQRLVDRGAYTKPFFEHEGCRFQPGDEGGSWEETKQALWGPWLD